MTTSDTSTDPLQGFAPTDIIVGSGGQTLADATASERAHTITIPTMMIDGRPAHASVPEMIAAVCRAAIRLAPHPFVVQYDEGEWIVAVTDDEDYDGCSDTDAPSRTAAATRMVTRLLPTWARSSTHEVQTRAFGPLVYAQQDSSGSSWRVTLDAWGKEWQSQDADLSASSCDEAAQLLWQHAGCPRAAGVVIVPSTGEAIWYDVDDWTIAAGAPYWEPVHAFTALTRADSDRALPDGTDEIVREIHRARTTDARHASRCRAARASMIQYVLDECWSVPASDMGPCDDVQRWVRDGGDEPTVLASWTIGIPCARDIKYTAEDAMRILGAIAAMEMHGIGGPGGIDGGATATMSWRRGLGKGRRQASDGAAWDAAIDVHGEVSAADVTLALPFVRPHDLEWPMALALDRAYHHRDDAETSRAWCDVARAVMERAQEPGAPIDGPAVQLGRRYGL